MIRHVFIATIKEGISKEIINQKMEEMRHLKEDVSVIEKIIVEKNLGWIGSSNCITMIIDVSDRDAFDILMKSPAHLKISEHADEVFDTSSFVASQIMIENLNV